MVSADRQTIIETNKSLRIIKNELESLYEKGVIDDQAYDSINSLLPAEASLAGARAAAAPSSSSSTPAPAARAPPPAAPTPDMSNLSIQDNNARAPPPPYGNPSPAAAAPPPPPPSGKPVLSHARALYRYAGADARDCAFERDDRIAVHEYMNADWWMGRNLRTGREGIFPRNYVELEAAPVPAPAPVASPQQGYPVNEKAVGGGYYGGAPPPQQQQQQQQPYGQPAYGYQQQPQPQQNPYNAPVPPMAVANPPPAQQQEAQPQKESFAKKAGSKLGNAALFGAGATLGGNIVNSIF
ncbi:hypothetical protein RB594_004778 [Gaeumannomyces avenae]